MMLSDRLSLTVIYIIFPEFLDSVKYMDRIQIQANIINAEVTLPVCMLVFTAKKSFNCQG